MFNDKELTTFGTYLLSNLRKETLFPEADTNLVYHSDYQNFIKYKYLEQFELRQLD